MLRKTKDFFILHGKTLYKFIFDGFTYRASALTYTTLLALVPLLLVIVFVVSLFPEAQQIFLIGEQYILTNFVPAAAQTIKPYFETFITQSNDLPTISFLFLVITTLMLVYEIQETMNEIWGVPRRKYRVFTLLFQWLIFLLLPFFIGFSMLFASYLFFITWLAGAPDDYTKYVLAILPIIINTGLLSLLYIGVPNAKVSWKDGLLGGFIAALLFEGARAIFTYYVKQFPTYSLIYGAFATIPIFLIWLYIFWCIVLYGALFIYMLNQSKNKPIPNIKKQG